MQTLAKYTNTESMLGSPRRLMPKIIITIIIIMFQRVSVLVQRFNGVLLHDSFVFKDCPE